MPSTRSKYSRKSWRKSNHVISTDTSLIPIQQLITIFDSPEVYWAKSFPAEDMKEMLENALNFGLYECPPESLTQFASPEHSLDIQPQSQASLPADSRFIGLARCVTDYTTFLYLTDVWVDPKQQGAGLGRWLISTVQEVIASMPYLRRSMLFTGDWERSVPFYEELMGMQVMETKPGEGLAIMEMKGPGHPTFWR